MSRDAAQDGADEERTPASLADAAVAGVRWITAARGFSEVVGLGAMVVLARLIPPAEFGKFVIALVVHELAMSILGESVGNAIVQRPEIRREHLRVAQVVAVVLGLLLAGLTVLAAPLVFTPVFGSETATLVLLSTPMFLIVALGTVPMAMLQRSLAFRRIGIIQIIGLFVRCAGAVSLAVFAGMEAEALVFAALAAGAVGTGLAMAWVRLPRPGIDVGAARELAVYGVPAGFASISWIGFRNADYTIVGARLGLASTGIYWRAFQLAVEYQKKISAILYQIAFPLLSRTSSVDEMFALRLRMVRLLTVTVFPLLAGLALFAPTLIPWLFGETWSAAVLPAQILTAAGASTLVIDAVGTTLMAAGRPRMLLAYGWSHFVVYSVVLLLVAPFGVVAVSAAAAGVHVVFLFVAYGMLLRDYVERPLLQLWSDIAPASVSSAAAVAVALPVLWGVGDAGGPPAVALLAASLAATPVYLLVLKTCFSASWRDLTTLAGRVIPQRLLRRRPHDVALAGVTPPRAKEGEFMSVSVSVVVAAYNSERWIEDTLESILSQTHPPHEVIVVDDGSTDGTAGELRRFGEAIRVITRENGGCPAAFNTAFAAATGDYVALCGSDDLWEPRKLELQVASLAAHPEIDIACGHARVFGIEEGAQPRPDGTGLLDRARLTEHLYRGNTLCAPSVVIRRSLFERLGPFVEQYRRGDVVERFNADDYEYWMRALRAGAQFFYDPRVLVSYRRHDGNITNDYLHMRRSTHAVHRWYASEIADRRLVRETLAADLFMIARDTVDAGRPREARAAFLSSLRHRPSARALAWALVMGLPSGVRERAAQGLVAAKRTVAPPDTTPATRWPTELGSAAS